MTTPQSAVETMLAEWRIRDVIGRYARGCDRRDVDMIRGCFHADARHHYGAYDGGLEGFIPWVLAEVNSYSRTVHFMGLSIIDWPDFSPGPVAVVETYATALHLKDGGDQRDNWVAGLRYLDRFELRPDEVDGSSVWKIAERTVVGDVLRVDSMQDHRRFPKVMVTGRTGPEDTVYQLLAQLRP